MYDYEIIKLSRNTYLSNSNSLIKYLKNQTH